MYVYADSAGLHLEFLSRLRVRLAYGIRQSHLDMGKFGLTDAMPALKWFFHVWIARSARLRWWECGGTSWNLVELFLKAIFKSSEILLSRTQTAGAFLVVGSSFFSLILSGNLLCYFLEAEVVHGRRFLLS